MVKKLRHIVLITAFVLGGCRVLEEYKTFQGQIAQLETQPRKEYFTPEFRFVDRNYFVPVCYHAIDDADFVVWFNNEEHPSLRKCYVDEQTFKELEIGDDFRCDQEGFKRLDPIERKIVDYENCLN